MSRTKRKNLHLNKPEGLQAHHIIPLHAGGLDNKSNIVFLTIEQHAEEHLKLFEEHGRWQDKIAWQMLSGMIGKEDAINTAQKNADKTWMKTAEGKQIMKDAWKKSKEAGNRSEPWNKGLSKDNDARLERASIRAKENQINGSISCIGDHMRGKQFDNAHKENLSLAAKNRTKIICPHCQKSVISQMYKRWHGDACKSRRGGNMM
jgi:hypothetical protein